MSEQGDCAKALGLFFAAESKARVVTQMSRLANVSVISLGLAYMDIGG